MKYLPPFELASPSSLYSESSLILVHSYAINLARRVLLYSSSAASGRDFVKDDEFTCTYRVLVSNRASQSPKLQIRLH
jgi:hypothetical protein